MKLWGFELKGITHRDALLALEEGQLIFTPNPEMFLELRENKKFKRALKKGTLFLPDGHGLLLVSTLRRFSYRLLRFLFFLPALFFFLFWKKGFKKEFLEVIHGSDFMAEVVAWANLNERSVYFLGARDEVAEKTAAYFQKRYPDLKVAGFSNVNPGQEAFELVKKAEAEVLFVAYGAPQQEIWLAKYAPRLPSLHLAMGVGGSFDFWSGTVRRAPKWMRKLGLEWLWRLFLNPRQRLKRIFNAFVKFPLLALWEK